MVIFYLIENFLKILLDKIAPSKNAQFYLCKIESQTKTKNLQQVKRSDIIESPILLSIMSIND